MKKSDNVKKVTVFFKLLLDAKIERIAILDNKSGINKEWYHIGRYYGDDGEIQQWSSHYVMGDGDYAELYIHNNHFELCCFSGIELSTLLFVFLS